MRDYTRYGGSRLEGGMASWCEAVCTVCGKRYMRTSQHVYKDCCSWSCLCRVRKREEEAERAYEEALERAKIQKRRAKIEERILKCERKIAYHSAMIKAARTKERREGESAMRTTWRRKLKEAKAQLASLQS